MNTLSDVLTTKGEIRFREAAHYHSIGDFVSYFSSDARCFAERVDDFLTVYRTPNNNNELVGCKIKGVKRILQKIGAVDVIVEDDHATITLGMILAGAQALAGKTEEIYYDLSSGSKASLRIDIKELRKAA